MPKGDHRLKIDIGSIFGDLTVKSEAPKNGYKRHFVCECVCGEDLVVPLTRLRHGKQESCRACSFENAKNKVIPGQIFGELTVLNEEPERVTFNPNLKRPKRNRRYVKCRCSCGKEYVTPLHSLLSGKHLRCYTCGRKPVTKFSIDEQSARRAYLEYRKGAESRNLGFFLTFEEFCSIATGKCRYCGKKDTNKKEPYARKHPTNAPTFYYTGIDRVDSSKPYEIGNCVPCCKICNIMKMALPLDVFLEHIKNIYNNVFLEKVEILPELEKDIYDDK